MATKEKQKNNQIVTDIISSMTAVNELAGVAKVFGLTINQTASLEKIAHRVVTDEISVGQMEYEIAQEMGFDADYSRKIAVSVAGSYLLAIDKWLDGSVANYLKSCGADLVQFASVAASLQAAPDKEKLMFEKENEPEEEFVFTPRNPEGDLEKSVNQGEEKDDMIDLFEHRVLDTIAISNAEILDDYNHFLISSFSDDKKLYVAVQQALKSNQEEISPGTISLDGKEVPATVSNFISDLLKSVQTSDINEMSLVQYFSSSPNFRKLSPSGKNVVRKVFGLYINLWLLFENLDSKTVEEIEIFPIREEQDDSYPSGSPAEPKGKNNYQETGGDRGEIEALRQMLSHYVAGSLEYKAIEEEISRLKESR